MFLIKKDPQKVDITDLEENKYLCILELITSKPNVIGAIIGKDKQRLKAYLADFLKASEQRGINTDNYIKFDRKTNQVLCVNGSKICFVSASEIEILRGLELKFVLVEDEHYVSDNDFDLIKSRIR